MSSNNTSYYTSMVAQYNHQAAQAPNAAAVATDDTPHKAHQPYRSPGNATRRSVPTLSTTAMAQVPAPTPQRVPRPTAYTPLSATSLDGAETRPAPRLYTHNPYASSCTTPTLMPVTSNSMEISGTLPSPYASAHTRSGAIGTPKSRSASSFPVYQTPEMSSADVSAAAGTLEAQFFGLLGSLPASAMTSRGRHLLLSVLRLQHVDKIQMIFEELAPQVNVVALDQQGCHVMRTLIEYLTTAQLEQLVSYLEPEAVRQMAMSTQNTRRVLQSIFEHHTTEALMPLVDIMKADCERLSKCQQGCIAVIRIIEYATPTQKKALVAALVPVLPSLAKDQFGNYVVQCILRNMEGYVTVQDLVGSFHGHWVSLCCDKYSSNVMEGIIGMLKGDLRQRILQELIFDEGNLHCLMQNNFGNYVLQAVIGTAGDKAEFLRIHDSVAPFLHTSPYGHRIEARLKGRYEALFKATGSSGVAPVDNASR